METAPTLLELFQRNWLSTFRQHHHLPSLLLRFARNRFLFTYNTRNYQRNVRNDVKSKLKTQNVVPSLLRNTLLNTPPAGTATRTLAAGTHCSVT
jgi:hypothetical protein